MLLEEFPALEELVLQALVQEPGATAKRIYLVLMEQGHSYSLRGLYKELGKMEGQGILFKRGETYNIRLAWIMNLLAFADRAYERYTDTPYLAAGLRDENAKHTEGFNDLRKLDRLWTQLILVLHNLHPGKIMCFWCPYQWFYLAHYYTEKQFYKAIDLAGHKRCHIIGIDSYLSRLALKDLPKAGCYSFAKSPFDRERANYYTVIGDCVLTVKLDKQITSRIHELFSAVRTQSDIRPLEIEAIFGAKVRASLTSERNEEKASRLKKKFADFFGVEIF